MSSRSRLGTAFFLKAKAHFSNPGCGSAGPFPPTRNGSRYVLVVADYFTKWAEAYSCSTMEAEETAELLVTQFFAKFGPPDTIHSDQGRTFEASLIGNLFELFGIEKTRTTPYHPQSNGLVERFNQTLPDVLKGPCIGDTRKLG
ncbi:integrase core domain protein [Trichuris suis]|nr:integrase core domain protein [Trichuris suis]